MIALKTYYKLLNSSERMHSGETAQQKATEEIYLLTLEQQAILEEKKVQERNRISQELHDGILGKLFGTIKRKISSIVCHKSRNFNS